MGGMIGGGMVCVGDEVAKWRWGWDGVGMG